MGGPELLVEPLQFIKYLLDTEPLAKHSVSFPVAQWERICLSVQTQGFDPWVGKIPWRRTWQPISVFLPGKSHGQRSLVDYHLWGHKSWT